MTVRATEARVFSLGPFQLAWESLALLITPSLALLSCLVSFARYHSWSLFAPEFVYCALGVIVIGIPLGGLLVVARAGLLRVLAMAFLLFLFLDLQFGYAFLIEAASAHLPNLGLDTQVVQVILLALICWAGMMTMNAMQKNLGAIFATVFSTILFSTAVLPAQTKSFGTLPTAEPAQPAADLPPMVHLVLDGHIGIEGIPMAVEGGAETKEALKAFYRKWGFRLFGRAYSPYMMTFDSLSNLLNGDATDIRARYVDRSRLGESTLLRNSYFEKYAKQGYRIRVYQTEYMDFCAVAREAIEHCFRYPVSSPRVANHLEATTAERTLLFAARFVTQSGLYQALQGLLPNPAGTNGDVYSLPVPAIAERVARDVEAFPRGRLFFAHLLLPHGPYAWNADCRRHRKAGHWLSPKPARFNILIHSTPEFRDQAYGDYLQQVGCSLQLLDRVLSAMADKGVLDKATIVVHGDHGSRIVLRTPTPEHAGLLSPEDYIAAYSTLFAIRSPDVVPGYDTERRALHNLFAEQLLDTAPPVKEPMVYLQSDRMFEKAAMPDF